jgi:hypothetical protein
MPLSLAANSSPPSAQHTTKITSRPDGWTIFQQTIQAEYWVYWVIWVGTAIAAGLASFILLDPILEAL